MHCIPFVAPFLFTYRHVSVPRSHNSSNIFFSDHFIFIQLGFALSGALVLGSCPNVSHTFNSQQKWLRRKPKMGFIHFCFIALSFLGTLALNIPLNIPALPLRLQSLAFRKPCRLPLGRAQPASSTLRDSVQIGQAHLYS